MVKKNTTLDVFMKGNAKAEKQKQETETEGLYPLPEGWKWMRVKDVAKSLGGGTPSKNNPEYWGGTIPWISPKDMQAFEIFYSQDYITEKGLVESTTNLIEPNSVLIVFRSGILRRKIPIAINRVPVTINQDLKALIPKRAIIIPEFLAYYLKSIENYIITRCVEKGATVHRIISKRFFELAVPLPPLEEQKRIVSRLEQLVSRVEKAKKLRKLAKEEAEKIMQVALHNVFSKAEEKGWKWVRLESIAKVVGGHTPKRNVPDYWNGDIPWIVPTELPSNTITVVRDSREKITQKGLKNSSAVLLPPGTVLYTTRATIGKVAIAGVPLTTNQGFTNFICSNRVYNWYLAYCLMWLTPLIRKEAGQTTFSEVKRSRLRKVKIPLPPFEEQKKIVAYLNTLRRDVESLRKLQQITDKELERLAPAILDKAFKGEL